MEKVVYEFRPLFTAKTRPDFIKGKSATWAVMQLPMYCQLADCTLDSVVIREVYIMLNDSSDHAMIDEIVASLAEAIGDNKVKVKSQYAVLD